jgi:ribosome biogenesis GTPase
MGERWLLPPRKLLIMSDLSELGWDEKWSQSLAALGLPGVAAGRVVAEDRRMYTVWTVDGERRAEAAGKLLYRKTSWADLPKVGDWVALTELSGEGRVVIQGVLPRRSRFSRKAAGRIVDEQVLAANVDVLFIVQALDHDFNLRRLDRYLAMAWDGGVAPVVVLNKTDICEDVAARVAAVQRSAGAAPIIAISAANGDIAPLRAFLRTGLTFAFVGSSGVGKSTIINVLAGEELQATYAVNARDGEGRHTTIRRQLLIMPDGSLLIDTPGMRELGLWTVDEGLSETFADIEELALRCRFSNCTHTHEARCAVRAAVESGAIDEDRYRNYVKLLREAAALGAHDARSEAEARRTRDKTIAKFSRRYKQMEQEGYDDL